MLVIFALLTPAFTTGAGIYFKFLTDILDATAKRLQGNDELRFDLGNINRNPPALINFGNIYFISCNGRENDHCEASKDVGGKSFQRKSEVEESKGEFRPAENTSDAQKTDQSPDDSTVAVFSKESLFLPGGIKVTNVDLKWMLQFLSQDPGSIEVHVQPKPTVSLPTFFSSTDRAQLNEEINRGFVVFPNGRILPLKCAVSVISFWRVLMSHRKNEPINLSRSEFQNVSAFFKYLVQTEDVRLDDRERTSFYLNQPVESSHGSTLFVLDFPVPYTDAQRYINGNYYSAQ